jgi:hypothetical protein
MFTDVSEVLAASRPDDGTSVNFCQSVQYNSHLQKPLRMSQLRTSVSTDFGMESINIFCHQLLSVSTKS